MHMDDSVLWSSYFTNWESQTFSGEPSGSMVLATPVGANNNQAVCIQLQVSWQYGGRVDGVGQSIQNARFRILSSSGFSASNRDIEITLSTTVGNGANVGNTTYPMALLPLTLQVPSLYTINLFTICSYRLSLTAYTAQCVCYVLGAVQCMLCARCCAVYVMR